jgi:hypothetical protein
MKAVKKIETPNSVDIRFADFVQKYLEERLESKKLVRRLEFLLTKREMLESLLLQCVGINLSQEVMNPKPWLVVDVGTSTSKEAKKELIDGQGNFFADHYFETYRLDWSLEKTQKKIGLIRLSGYNLGFGDNKVSYNDVCTRAKMLGFDICPDETPFQVVRQHREAVIAAKNLLFATNPMPVTVEGSTGSAHAILGMLYGGTPVRSDGTRLPSIRVDKYDDKFKVHINLNRCKPDRPYTPAKEYVFTCPLVEQDVPKE